MSRPPKRAFFILVLFITAISLVLGQSTHHSSPKHHSLFTGEPVSIPFRLLVGLIGFSGDGGSRYHLDVDVIQSLLKETLHSYQPTCQETLQKVPYEFIPNIHISTSYPGALKRYQNLIQEQLSDNPSSTIQPVRVDRSAFTAFFDGLFSNSQSSTTRKDYTLFILNPDISATYGLVFGDTGVPSKAFVGSDRYSVLDISASCYYGSNEAGAIVTWDESYPSLKALAGHELGFNLERHKGVEASIAATVVSAVQQVFLPDLLWEDVSFSEKILVPIIFFQNHNLWDSVTTLDQEAVKKRVRDKLQVKGQDIQFVVVKRSLHDQKQVSLAIARSLRTHIRNVVDEHIHFVPKATPYIDSKALISELGESSDSLTQGILSHSLDKEVMNVFFNPQNTMLDLFGDSSGADASSSKAKKQQSHGTRVLPVYVFSLAGEEKGLLLDGDKYVAASKDMVVVLQTPESASLPFQSQFVELQESSKDVTPHIIAGLLSSLGGIPPPSSHFSSADGVVLEDFRWSSGCLPWRPFGGCKADFSKLYSDHVVRNIVLSRVSSASRALEAAVAELEAFIRLHVQGPFGEALTRDTFQDSSFFDSLFYHEVSASPGEEETLQKLTTRVHRELTKVEGTFQMLGQDLTRQDVEKALRRTKTLELETSNLLGLIETELIAAKRELACCEKRYKAGSSDSQQSFNGAGAGSSIFSFLSISSFFSIFALLFCSAVTLSTFAYLISIGPSQTRQAKYMKKSY